MVTGKKLNALNKQSGVLERMQQRGFNVICCCICGEVILTEGGKYKTMWECPHCANVVDKNDCTDLYN